MFAEKLNGKEALITLVHECNYIYIYQWVELPDGRCYSTDNADGIAWCEFPSKNPAKGTIWNYDPDHTAEIIYINTKLIKGKTETVYGIHIKSTETPAN